MGSVFLSHSHVDKPFVRRLAADLKAAGVDVWLDEAEIKIGDSLIRKIEESISTVEYVAACLSSNSIKSNWVTKELDIAMTREIKGKRVVVLPLLLENCEIPPFLSDKCYADFRNPSHYDAEFSKLLVRVKPDAELDLNSGATIDAERCERLVETAKKAGMRDRVVDHLVEALPKRVDDTERYWIYIALGKIGGPKAQSAIKKGLIEENEFARDGAKTAWELIRH
jgi:hypothetical protein